MPSMRRENTVPKPQVARSSWRHFVIVHYHLNIKTAPSVAAGVRSVNKCLFNRYYGAVARCDKLVKINKPVEGDSTGEGEN